MLYSSTALVFLIICFSSGYSLEEDSLKNALNSIENRQRQLTSSYHTRLITDPQRHFQSDDEGLMYLDEPHPSDRDVHTPNRFSSKSSSNSHSYGDGTFSESENDEFRKALNERFLEQLMLDVLNNNDDDLNRRTQKKSFFREREINGVSDNLQNLKSEFNIEQESPPQRKSQRLLSSYQFPIPSEDREFADDYLNSISFLQRRYEDDRSVEDLDPESLSNGDIEEIPVRTLIPNRNSQRNSNFDQAPSYDMEDINIDPRHNIRYWPIQRNLIQKRSTSVEEKPVTANITTNVTSTTNLSKIFPPQKSKADTKREKRSQKEVPIPSEYFKPLNIKKKSIDWSNYFGVDKRAKKSNPSKDPPKGDALLDQYIQSYILQSVRNSAFNNRGNNYGYSPKRSSNFREVNLDEINKKLEIAEDLGTAEDLIIDHVLKYTGAHEGINNPVELQQFRQEVIDELAAAYNLEKLRNEILGNSEMTNVPEGRFKKHQHTNEKRVASMNENAELLPSDSKAMKKKHNVTVTNQYRYETDNPSQKSCPILNDITDNCVQISLSVNDRDSIFMPLCCLHYICTICSADVTESIYCDLDFYKNLNLVCSKEESACQNTARQALSAIKSEQTKFSISKYRCDPCIAEILQYS